MSTSIFTLKDQTPLFVLVGACNCRSYHLTTDTLASDYIYSGTDEQGTMSFTSLCGKTIVDTLVQTSTINPDSVCKCCLKKSERKVEA